MKFNVTIIRKSNWVVFDPIRNENFVLRVFLLDMSTLFTVFDSNTGLSKKLTSLNIIAEYFFSDREAFRL